MLHGASDDGVFLEGLGAVDVATCTRETGLTAKECEEFMLVASLPSAPPVSSMLIRGTVKAAILAVGTKACTGAAAAQGVPAPLAKAGCSYLMAKIMPLVGRLLDAVGKPAMLKRSMLIGMGPIFSRPCSSPAELLPGEHFMPAFGGWAPSRCELNVAVLRPRDKPVEAVVYVPCEYMPAAAVTDVLPRPVTACRDRDGVIRPTGRKAPQASPGLYLERYRADEDGWPASLEKEPWQGDRTLVSVSLPAVGKYPTGSIGAFDSTIGVFRVAVPVGLSGPAAYREVATSPTLPSGVAEVDLPTYEKQTGTRPWYKKGTTWAALVTGSAAVAVGAVVLSRRRGRRRR